MLNFARNTENLICHLCATAFSLFLALMKHKKNWIIVATLAILALTINLFSSNSYRVEQYYSTRLYPYISVFLRYIFGWLPVSIGDLLYAAIVIWLLVKLFKAIRAIYKKRFLPRGYLLAVQSVLIKLLVIYILFNALWGINYNRQGIASQLDMSTEKYSLADLKILNGLLLKKVNASSTLLSQQHTPILSSKEIFSHSAEAYDSLVKTYPFLNYQPPSLKVSLWSWLGNYVGFLGYYNPFTGEGQVNITGPKFLQPYTYCHEIAHQLGYAKENEANFVGYLAAAASKNEPFHYSVYLDLFLYANSNLYNADSAAAKSFRKDLLPAVKQDLKEWRQFNLRYKNPIEPVIRWMYGIYLENNQQPSGILSYDEVTGLLIAYHKKYGKL